jgi:hypothetical protein
MMKQLTVVCEDRPNLIAELIEAVASSGANLETLDSQSIAGTVVAILTVDRYDVALQALARAGLPAVSEEAILVNLEDRPGALAAIAHRFREAGIPLRSVRILRRAEGLGLVALSTPRTAEALALVSDVLIA